MSDFLGQSVFVSVDGDSIGAAVGRASLANDVEALRRLSQDIERGNALWTSWASASLGTIVSAGGDEARVEVPARVLGELQSLRAQYHSATGATCTVGVGLTTSESDRALLYGKMHGKDRVVFYTPDIDAELEELVDRQAHRSETSKIAEEYLGKGDVLAFPPRLARAPQTSTAGVPAPVVSIDPARRQAAAVLDAIRGMPRPEDLPPLAAAPKFRPGDEVMCSHSPGAHAPGKCWRPQGGRVVSHDPLVGRPAGPAAGQHMYMVNWGGAGVPAPAAEDELRPRGRVLPFGKAEGAGAGAGFETPGPPQPQVSAASKSGSQGQQAAGVIQAGRAAALDGASVPQSASGIPVPQGPEQQLHAHAERQRQQDGAVSAVQAQQSGRDALRQQVVKVLQQMKAAAPLLEQVRAQAPQVYKAVTAAMQAMVAMARQLNGPGAGATPPDGDSDSPGQEKGPPQVAKSEAEAFGPLEKMACIHDDAAKPMTVYRVQDAEGRGPYAQAAVPEGLWGNTRTTPAPHRDFIDDPQAYNALDREEGNARGLFGFERPEDADAWFGRAGMNKLRVAGFDVVPRRASRVHRSMSGKQVLFTPAEGQGLTSDKYIKGELPMPGASAHPAPMVLPVGATKDGKVKVRHADGKAGWVEVRAGQVLSQDGHPVSARNPGGR
jgi:hypothetical protein